MTILINLCLALFVFVALLMVLLILMQRPKSEGLGAAFGGGVTENIFGAQTTNVLTKMTAWLAGIFFLLTFALSVLYAHKSMGDSALHRELMKAQGATQSSPSPATPQVSPAPVSATQPSPVSSTAPGANVSVLPTATAAAFPGSSAQPSESPKEKSGPKKPK
jgi:preprotein translocase subunit SecG